MDNAKALKKNIISNGVLFFLNGIIGFWLPPFLIKKLGVGAYGMIPLATTLIGYASVITVGINGALSRFLAISLEKHGSNDASQVFNTALVSIGSILMCILPVFIIFSLNVPSYISVPEGYGQDAIKLFLCISVSFTITCLTSVFNTSAYVANRLDLVNQVTVINTLFRVIVVLLIYLMINVSLFGYGIAVLIGSFFAIRYSYFLFKKYTPAIRIKLSDFNKGKLRQILSMGVWLIIIQLGSILFLQIDLVVINKLLGNQAAGRYSVILQWSNLIRTLSIYLSGALAPLILTLYVKDEIKQAIKITALSNKVIMLFITCMVSVLCILGESLLNVWVGQDFAQLKTLFWLVLLPLPINLGVLPLFSLNRAYNKVKIPGIFTCAMGVVNLFLAIFLVKYTSLGLYGVATASAIVLTIKNFIFMPIYVAGNLGINRFTFFRSSFTSILFLALAIIISFYYKEMFTIDRWRDIIIHGGILFVVFAFFSFLTFKKEEKGIIFEKLLRKKRK